MVTQKSKNSKANFQLKDMLESFFFLLSNIQLALRACTSWWADLIMSPAFPVAIQRVIFLWFDPKAATRRCHGTKVLNLEKQEVTVEGCRAAGIGAPALASHLSVHYDKTLLGRCVKLRKSTLSQHSNFQRFHLHISIQQIWWRNIWLNVAHRKDRAVLASNLLPLNSHSDPQIY